MEERPEQRSEAVGVPKPGDVAGQHGQAGGDEDLAQQGEQDAGQDKGHEVRVAGARGAEGRGQGHLAAEAEQLAEERQRAHRGGGGGKALGQVGGRGTADHDAGATAPWVLPLPAPIREEARAAW